MAAPGGGGESHTCYDRPGDCHGDIQNDDNEPGHVTHDPCDAGLCHEGATCESHDGTFTCYCPKERTGKFCERALVADIVESVLGFTGRSRVKLINSEHKLSTPKYSLSFRMRPVSGEGVILHSGDTILALVNGHLQFSYGHNVTTGGELVIQIEMLASEIFIGGLGSSHHSQPGYTGCLLAELKLVTVVAPPSWRGKL